MTENKQEKNPPEESTRTFSLLTKLARDTIALIHCCSTRIISSSNAFILKPHKMTTPERCILNNNIARISEVIASILVSSVAGVVDAQMAF